MASLKATNDHPITQCGKPVYVKERKARNPLRCEKTPRTHYQEDKHWDFAIPPGETFPSKWNYDCEDRPLMEQFSSLRAKVREDDERVRAHNARIKAFQDSQALLATQKGAEGSVMQSARSSANSTGRSSRIDSTRVEDEEAISTVRSTTRTNDPFGTGRASGRETGRSEKDLTSFPASSLKSLQHEHPEILSKMRAQRAAKYVTSLRNPLDPPAYNSISSRQSFCPAGTNMMNHQQTDKNKSKSGGKNKSSGKIVLTSRNIDTSRMKESLGALVDELEKTDSQIQRQELKIALAPKVKAYDKKSSKK